jgi:hypothetical protein
MSVPIEADGTVHFRAVPAGEYHAVVKCLDHVLVEGPTLVEVASAAIDNLIWKVDAGIGLVVHMVDEGDHPQPEAISWLTSSTSPVRMALVANADGVYDHTRMLYPGTFTLTPGHGGSDGDPVSVELREGMEKVDVTVRFKGQCAIIATVRGSDSEPIDDMTVRAVSVIRPEQTSADDPKAPRERPYEAIPLGNGRFQIGHLPPGRYRVQAADGVNPPFEASGPPGGILQVSKGVVDATIVVNRGASVRGRVVDPSSQPAPDTWVSASCKRTVASETPPGPSFGRKLRPFAGKRTITNQDGQFTLKDLEDSAVCTVRAEQPFGMAGMTYDVSPGASDVVVALAPVDDPSESASVASGPGGPATGP